MPSRRPRLVTTKHYLIIPFEAWGHSRPEITLSLHLLRSHPHLLITLLLSSITLDKTLPLISSFDLDSSEADRLRVVPYPNLTAPPANPLETDEDDAAIWRITNWWVDKIMPPLLKYLKGERVCDPPEQSPHAQPPDVYIVDKLLTVLPRLQDAGMPAPRYLAILPMSLPFAETVAKVGDPRLDRVMSEYMQLLDGGMGTDQAFDKTVRTKDELLDQSSGLGPMYIREMDPLGLESTRSNTTARWCTAMRSWHHLRQAPSGETLIVIWPSCFSPPSQEGVMTIGPQPSTFAQPKEDDINRFLDRQPPKSLVYICFGSYTWIPNLRQTKILFDTIDKLGLGVLVINSLMTLFSSPRTDLLKLINERLERLGEKGMLVDWAPQEVVLRQQAVAFMLSHAGSNSAQECMIAAMPSVVWPGGWDQPHVASEVCELGIARELIQVRTGHNVGRETACGILVKGTDEAIVKEMEEVFMYMISEDGDVMRERCEQVRKMVVEDMESGISHDNMLALGRM